MSDSNRGGMSKNPFCGHERIDRINLLDHLGPDDDPNKVMFSYIIQDAASNYLFTFLGKNGTSPEEFFSSWQYFFNITSDNKKSWSHCKTMKRIYTSRGERFCDNHILTDDERQMMCFDQHYHLSGMADYVDIDQFRTRLKNRRRKILTENWDQVKSYIDSLYQKEWNQIANNKQIPLRIWDNEALETLIDPPTPIHLASLIYVPSKLKKSRKSKTRNPSNTGKYQTLFNSLNNINNLSLLDKEWGPLSILIGE